MVCARFSDGTSVAVVGGMKTILFAATFALVAAGCLATYVPAEPIVGPDMAKSGTGGNGGSGGGGGGGSGGGGGGASTDMAQASSTDMAGSAGAKNFGDLCNGPVTSPPSQADCSAGLICAQFVMGAVKRCTKLCSNPPAPATDCPAPSAGQCTNATPPYCKFNQ